MGKILEPPTKESLLLEPMGPTPKPSVTDLREWDRILMGRYKPFYAPLCDQCCWCTFGKCDLTENKRGACGIDLQTQQGRVSLFTSVTGAACHTAHTKHLLEYIIKKFGADYPIKLGDKTPLEAPITRTVTGIIPKKMDDLREVVTYLEGEITDLLAVVHFGQESSTFDFESKALHAGMLDLVALEASELAQIPALKFPVDEANTPFVEMGLGTVDRSKPVIVFIGHNVAGGVEAADYVREVGMKDKVELCGICCTALDLGRYSDNSSKIIGPLSRQMEFLRTGIADIIVADEQCVRADLPREALKTHTPIIATLNKIAYGFPNRTDASVEAIMKELLDGAPGVLILDPRKASEVAVKTAVAIAPKRAKFNQIPDENGLKDWSAKCNRCMMCVRACPHLLAIDEALPLVAKGEYAKLLEVHDGCSGCGRCEQVCPQDIPIVSLMYAVRAKDLEKERYKIRAGRGPIQDWEIRIVAENWGMGTIPGLVAFVGCPSYTDGAKETYDMAEELLLRNFIVSTSGCAAMSIGMFKDENNETLYQRFPGNFDYSCLVNVGSCVSNAHIAGAAIRVANVFGRRILRGNYAEIADYILNRVGAVGVAWGAITPKAYAIATGCNRMGIPVILGPQGSKYRRLFLGRKEDKESFAVKNVKTGEKMNFGATPEHLIYWAETKGEAMVMASKLCFRANDIPEGRQVKILNYIDLYKQYYGKMPEDLDVLTRSERDIPLTLKDDILKILEKKGWKTDPSAMVRGQMITTLEPSQIWTFEAMKKGIKWNPV